MLNPRNVGKIKYIETTLFSLPRKPSKQIINRKLSFNPTIFIFGKLKIDLLLKIHEIHCIHTCTEEHLDFFS